eukprot:CAMPEP_0201652464 /NCGR_PEP_ID=MMETSP0493-20130528/44490_1 /ASSEMBLY_ACC=CAM_ASM_000838 /TAXON_ID=420259 /ORGANISM="Thalassiosira gravida, Strain GMp14c1" /LENGTH=80 /DNA_ID=CAMNT_0048128979 /DNA_START=1927 /DNA_END=2170 /DNA_ORIENTATION=+
MTMTMRKKGKRTTPLKDCPSLFTNDNIAVMMSEGGNHQLTPLEQAELLGYYKQQCENDDDNTDMMNAPPNKDIVMEYWHR